jgi:hypothetical protein
MSGVTWLARTASSTAASMAAAGSGIPNASSINAADAIAPIGFARFLPANFGADP